MCLDSFATCERIYYAPIPPKASRALQACIYINDFWETDKTFNIGLRVVDTLRIGLHLSRLIIVLRLLQDLTAIMINQIFDWLGNHLAKPMIHDALSLRWVLSTTLTLGAVLGTWIGILSSLALIPGFSNCLGLLESFES